MVYNAYVSSQRMNTTNFRTAHNSTKSRMKTRKLILIGVVIFMTASGVRLLAWQDAHLSEAGKVQHSVSADYKRVARLIADGGVRGFFSRSSPLSNPDNLGHPPGYSILIAAVQRTAGQSDKSVQFVQIFCDALAAVMLFLIIAELFSIGVATLAGLLSAFSPQFSWNSVLFLPDTLAVLPLMMAVYCLALAYKRPRVALIITAGALVGVSCWLRANALLLPLFLAALVFFLFERRVRLRYSLALVSGALLIILPLTIRNAVAFGHLIPVSLGAGQTFLEGIADYDNGQRFDLPNTDLGIMNQEAEAFGRPDYRETLFGPDGVQRERMRVRRGLGMVSSRPFWFISVMIRRAGGMIKLERTPLVAAHPPVTRSLAIAENIDPLWAQSPAQLATTGALPGPPASAIVSTDGHQLIVMGNESDYGKQFAAAPVQLEKHVEYLWRLPVKLEQGRIRVGVVNTRQDEWETATIIDTVEGKSPQEQPVQNVELPLVSKTGDQVQLTFANEGSDSTSVFHIGEVKLFQLGPASFVWTRYPRLLVRGVQKIFITAVMLPLALLGIAVSAFRRKCRVLAILLIIPAYYFCVQSATHTEYRYILALYHFLFAFAAVAVWWASASVWKKLSQRAETRAAEI